jgi:hypothetical protein
MFELWTIIRIVFSMIFTVFTIYINQFITEISEKNCDFAKSLYISNCKLITSLLMIIGIINIFVPINKFFASIPVIGSSYVLVFVVILFVELFILKRIASNLNDSENRKCRSKTYKSLTDFIEERSIVECFFATIIISIIFFYL